MYGVGPMYVKIPYEFQLMHSIEFWHMTAKALAHCEPFAVVVAGACHQVSIAFAGFIQVECHNVAPRGIGPTNDGTLQ